MACASAYSDLWSAFLSRDIPTLSISGAEITTFELDYTPTSSTFHDEIALL